MEMSQWKPLYNYYAPIKRLKSKKGQIFKGNGEARSNDEQRN
jgi:hypothetical protein